MSDQPVPSSAPAPVRRVRVHHLAEAKQRGERLTMLTAYDFATARIFDEAGIDLLLVGDSIGNTMLGHASPIPVTVDEMIPPTRAVVRAARRAPWCTACKATLEASGNTRAPTRGASRCWTSTSSTP